MATELEELSKKRATFDPEYNALQAAVANEPDPLTRLNILVDGIKSCFQLKTNGSKLEGPPMSSIGIVIAWLAETTPFLYSIRSWSVWSQV
jgi:hypothetical protein